MLSIGYENDFLEKMMNENVIYYEKPHYWHQDTSFPNFYYDKIDIHYCETFYLEKLTLQN
jgi:hypothetical protein